MKNSNDIKYNENFEQEKGIVIKNTGNLYIVRTDKNNEISCRIKGNFRIKGIRTTNPVAVGDRVEIRKATDDAFFITKIENRKNYIIRRASNLSKESHILAANIDQAFLVVSIVKPFTPTTFIDRFLATAEAYNIPATIIFNKCDIWSDDDLALADYLRTIYQNIGYKVIFISASQGIGLDEVKKIAKDKITLLAGNSGVGKTSLINALIPGLNLKTGEISDVHQTGTHTTTFSEMIDLPEGGELIDIPGIKGFGTIEFNPSEIGHYFPEIFSISSQCKYGNCRHLGEPGCAVLPAVEEGIIADSRYNSYLSIMEESEGKEGEDKYRKPF